MERFRDLVYIDDVVNIVIKLLENELFPTDILNIGTGKRTFVKEIIEGICEAVDKEYSKITLIQPKKTLGDINGIYADNAKLKQLMPEINFTRFSQGIKLMSKHYK